MTIAGPVLMKIRMLLSNITWTYQVSVLCGISRLGNLAPFIYDQTGTDYTYLNLLQKYIVLCVG